MSKHYYGKKNRKNLGIREQLLVFFGILTIFSLGIIGITTSIFMNQLGTVSTETSAEFLTAQAEQAMLSKTQNYARSIDTQLDHIAADVEGIAKTLNELLSQPEEFSPRRSYYHVDFLPAGTQLFSEFYTSTDEYFPANIPDDYRPEPKLDLNVSDTYSHYLIYKDTYDAMGQDEYNLTGIHGDLINRTAHLDPVLADVWHGNPDYAWIYIDFELGIQRTFPYTGVDVTVFGGNGNEFYDYKDDDWYIDAKNANGDVVWTSPYIDPYLGWMISISRAVFNGTETAENFVGVIGIDIMLDTITANVGQIEYLDSGYAALIDADGYVIAHPDVEFDPESEEGILFDEEEPLEEDGLSIILSSGEGFTDFVKDGEYYYMGYSTVNSSGYVLILIAPQEEVLAPVAILQAELQQLRAAQITTIIIIIGVVTAGVLVVGLNVANSVTKPIKKLADLAMTLATDDVKSAVKSVQLNFIDELTSDDEIGELAHAFKNLITNFDDED